MNIDSPEAAAVSEQAYLIDDLEQVFYPDNPADAARMISDHDAHWVGVPPWDTRNTRPEHPETETPDP